MPRWFTASPEAARPSCTCDSRVTRSAQGRRVLILVPEIALTPQVAAQFRAAFGDRVAIQHSGLADGERHDQWYRIRRGEVDLVVGTRSAVFAPLDRLGLIVVDEEHDGSYKQEETPRYNGRDVAVVRAREARALVVLGSATPAMESSYNAAAGRYRRVVLVAARARSAAGQRSDCRSARGICGRRSRRRAQCDTGGGGGRAPRPPASRRFCC